MSNSNPAKIIKSVTVDPFGKVLRAAGEGIHNTGTDIRRGVIPAGKQGPEPAAGGEEGVEGYMIRKQAEQTMATRNALPAIPTIDSEAVRQARRRQALALRARGGRASTILTGGSDSLGG